MSNLKEILRPTPQPAREEYRPDLATRIAIAKAQREQPPLISLSSTVPSYRADGG